MKKNVIMLLPLLLSLTLVGCNNEGSSSSSSSSSSKPSISSTISSSTTNSSSTSTSSTISKTKLASVENFKVNRNEEGKWVFNFDTVENALSYHLTGVVGENSFFEGDVTNDQVVEAGEEAGTYIFSLIAQNPDYLDSEAATYEIAVEIYNETDIGGIKYTGRKENEVPVGNYHLVYGDGSTFDGTLTADFKRANGKHQYTNLMYYEGEFNNDAFEGEGMFTWSTTGDYKDGSTYMGKFVGGNYNDQVGTFYTAAYWTKPVDYNGILTFTGTMGPAFGAPGKAGTVGKGEFSFANNSIYSGDLLKVMAIGISYVKAGVKMLGQLPKLLVGLLVETLNIPSIILKVNLILLAMLGSMAMVYGISKKMVNHMDMLKANGMVDLV